MRYRQFASKRLASNLEIANIAVVFILVLVFVPKGLLMRYALQMRIPDEVSIFYLKSLCLSEKNEAICQKLFDFYIILKMPKSAERVLTRGLVCPPKEKLYTFYKMLYFCPEATHEEKKHAISFLRARILDKIASRQDPASLERLYRESLSLGLRDVVLKDLKKLVDLDKERMAFWVPRYAAILHSEGRYKDASGLYLRLYQKTRDTKYFLKALNLLIEGDLLSDAVRLARRYEKRFVGNPEVTSRLINLYLSAGDMNSAHRLAVRAMRWL